MQASLSLLAYVQEVIVAHVPAVDPVAVAVKTQTPSVPPALQEVLVLYEEHAALTTQAVPSDTHYKAPADPDEHSATFRSVQVFTLHLAVLLLAVDAASKKHGLLLVSNEALQGPSTT